jgi:L-ascorbate metabolism protein UlaG (beta-lactamase superfamily)
MVNTQYYLKPNVLVEPLFNSWYAWTYLIAPHTAAMNIANLHLKIMKSYVTAPQVHASAVKNPAMLGGPFIDYQGGRVEEIRALMSKTTKEQAHLIGFAESVRSLNELLVEEGRGFSLEPLYAKVPENLKGYVELVYDLNHNPSIKFIEGLLYESEYYRTDSQSVALSLIERDERAFALSTPRLPGDGSLELKLPFAHKAYDELFRMKRTPQPLEHISAVLGLAADEAEVFNKFLTTERPAPAPRFDGEGVRIRYFGHACVLVETKDVSILIDPAVSYRYENGIERFTFDDLPDTIDYVLLTHGHQDHVILEALLQLRPYVKNVVLPRSRGGCLEDPSLKLIFQRLGFRNVVEIQEMESLEIEGGRITGLPFLGEHGDLDITSKMAHLIELRGKKFLFAADSNNLEPALYRHISKVLGDIDVLFLGMECDGAPMSWLYGPLLSRQIDRKMDQTRRFTGSNYERGMGIVNQFNCSEVYVYAMGMEPWLTYIIPVSYTGQSNPIIASDRLVEDCRARAIVSERPFGKKEIIYAAERVENALRGAEARPEHQPKEDAARCHTTRSS